MRRRAARAALLGPGGGPRAATPGPVAAVVPVPSVAPVAPAGGAAASVLCAWGAGGLWVGDDGGGALRRLPMHEDTAPPPVPVVDGLWLRQGRRQLARWRRDGRGVGSVVALHGFDDELHALAASPDGGHVLAAHGQRLSLLDGDGALLRRYDGTDLGRRRRGAARSLFHHDGRRSFIAAWPDLGEVWEIALDPAAPPIYDGLVHDYRMREGLATPGHLGVRRTPLETPMADIVHADGRLSWVAGMQGDELQVVHLDVRRRIAQWRQAGAAPQAGLVRRQADGWTWWLPVAASVQLIDATRWQPLGRIDAPGTVRALQAAGDAVWALCGDGTAATLASWRGSAWTPVPLPAGTPVAMHADRDGHRLLVATIGPSRLHLLDADGRALHAWVMPDDAAPHQVRWLPHKG